MSRPEAKQTRDPMTMSLTAIDKEIQAINKRYIELLELEQKIQHQQMEDTDRCLALKAARTVYTWPMQAQAH
jgi:hypothetical protein